MLGGKIVTGRLDTRGISLRACLSLSLSISLSRSRMWSFYRVRASPRTPYIPTSSPPPWGTPPRGLFRKATSRFQVFDTPRTPYQPSHILSRLLTLSQPLKLVRHPAHLRILLPVLFPFLLVIVIVIVIVLSILPLPLLLPLLQHPNPILE